MQDAPCHPNPAGKILDTVTSSVVVKRASSEFTGVLAVLAGSLQPNSAET